MLQTGVKEGQLQRQHKFKGIGQCGQTAACRVVLSGSSSWIAIFEIDSELSPHI